MKIKSISHQNVESTNDEAINLLKDISQPTMITSKRQTKGRGKWEKNGFPWREIYFFQFFEINEKISFKQFTKLNALVRKVLSKYIFKKIEINGQTIY